MAAAAADDAVVERLTGGTKGATDAEMAVARRGKSLTNQAYVILRRDILTCQIAPGQELSEQDIARRLKMSKTPVREALARETLVLLEHDPAVVGGTLAPGGRAPIIHPIAAR